MKKIAISITDQQARAVERIRRKERIPRSRVIQRAIDHYVSARAQADLIREYEEGYRRHPENLAEVAALTEMAAEVLEPEDWE